VFDGPLSALVTERFATRAGYSHALVKSLLVGALALGASLYYQLEQLASLARMAAKFGRSQPGFRKIHWLKSSGSPRFAWCSSVRSISGSPVCKGSRAKCLRGFLPQEGN